MLSFNEGKACDAIIRYLERREACSRSNLQFPEKERHPAPIELAFYLSHTLYALEHTGIEPFEGHMRMEAQASYLFQPVVDALNGTLDPSASFQLNIPLKALDQIPKRELGPIHAALIKRVKATAPTLPKRDRGAYQGFRDRVTISGVPFEVGLYRYDTTVKPGSFELRHIICGDLESARFARIEAACQKKFPKLAAWKRDESATSILVMEENDFQMTSHALVAESFIKFAATRSDRPDETYLVSTCSDPWHAWPILIGDENFFELERQHWPVGWEVDRAALSDLTNR